MEFKAVVARTSVRIKTIAVEIPDDEIASASNASNLVRMRVLSKANDTDFNNTTETVADYEIEEITPEILTFEKG